MARVFHRSAVDTPWSETTLDDDSYLLTGEGVVHQAALRSGDRPALRVLRVGAGDEWMLLADAPSPARVNGHALEPLRVRALRHGDEISLAGPRMFFATDDPVVVESYHGPADAHCPRCTRPLLPGQEVVLIPCCGVYLHEMESLRCFSYSSKCPGPQHDLPIDGGRRFHPRSF